ncbi:hypothetical protein [Bradyrhizobium ivorense]|uniref:hypothetical protein n=1 Tax=Bradyrhizobium ivorense TaxID=2511166 RepID=UPI0010B37185|nr:hypothetical protein [Bradyrhizobium ivorense]VIO73899.1 hypothetical protein CI41S_40080 [Bradyrhizobium ivorense]
MSVYVPGGNETDPKKIIRSLKQLASGRSNAVGVVTLAVSASSTTVTDQNCAVGSVIIPVPASADASAEWANGTIWIPTTTVTNGSFVIQHANNTVPDRIFAYAIIG